MADDEALPHFAWWLGNKRFYMGLQGPYLPEMRDLWFRVGQPAVNYLASSGDDLTELAEWPLRRLNLGGGQANDEPIIHSQTLRELCIRNDGMPLTDWSMSELTRLNLQVHRGTQFETLTSLKSLDLWEFKGKDLGGVRVSSGVDDLSLQGCRRLTSLRGFEPSRRVNSLSFDAPRLEDVDDLAHLRPSVLLLSRVRWESLDALPDEALVGLEQLFLSECRHLRDVSRLVDAPNLKRLFISACPAFDSVTDLQRLPALEWLDLHEREPTSGLEVLLESSSLRHLSLSWFRQRREEWAGGPLGRLTDSEAPFEDVLTAGKRWIDTPAQ